jgi:hypothetical protein
MLTAGVNPAAAVRAMWASTAGQSMAPSAVKGTSTAAMPVMVRRGRMRLVMSSGTGASRTGSAGSLASACKNDHDRGR